MGFLLDDDEQVAIRAAVHSGVAFSAYGHLHAFLHAGGDLHPHGLAAALQAGSVATPARIGDDLSFTAALGAGLVGDGPAEEAVHHALDLSAAVTGRAGLDIGLALGALAVAVGAGTVSFDGDLLLAAVGDLLEGQFDTGADVTAAV